MPKKRSTKTSAAPKKVPLAASFMVILFILALLGINLWAHYTFPDTAHTFSPDKEEIPATVVEQDITEPLKWEPADPDTHTNILLLGLDSRGFCDVIMIVSYDMENFKGTIISIKRDTFVYNQTWAKKDSGQDHLAWAYNRGMGQNDDYHTGARLTAKTIEELLGIDLHAYASISFDGFVNLVDLIGGVEINVDPGFSERINNPLPTGDQHLSGEQALTYARHRSNPRIPEPGSTTQDGDRVRRNQRLLKALLNQCKTLETNELLDIIDQLDEKLYTSLDDWDILDLFNLAYNQDPDKIETVVLPGKGEIIYQERIDKDVYYYFLDLEESFKTLQELGL